MRGWLIRLVSRAPVSVHGKLLTAFLAIVLLLIIVGAVGLRALSDVNRRAEDLVKLPRKIAAYRQLQHDTTAQLYSVSSALLVPNAGTLEATLRQLNQFGYDLDRLQFVAKDEVELLARVREDYDRFIRVVGHVVELIRGGRVADSHEVQLSQAGPLADRLERLTNELVNKAEADMVASIEASEASYATSRWVVIGFALGAIGLALILGYIISWSVITPVRHVDARLHEIAAGDFSSHVGGPQSRRAGNAGGQREPDERRVGAPLPAAGGGQPAQVGVPGQHVARAAHAAQRDHRVLRGAPRADVRRSQRQAGRIHPRHRRVRPSSALAHQRHPRSVQGRGGPDGAGADVVQLSGRPRGRAPADARARAPARHCARPRRRRQAWRLRRR